MAFNLFLLAALLWGVTLVCWIAVSDGREQWLAVGFLCVYSVLVVALLAPTAGR